MKIGSLSGEPFYRMHTPRWAVTPTSGAGAAKHGGRFNRPGVSALYLSDETQTAIAEYKQDPSLMPPGTLVQYELSLSAGIRRCTAGRREHVYESSEFYACPPRRAKERTKSSHSSGLTTYTPSISSIPLDRAENSPDYLRTACGDWMACTSGKDLNGLE